MATTHPRRTGRGRAGLGLLLLLALAAPAAADPLPRTIRTRFDPRVDGLPFANNGDYASPEGNCWGMSLLAIDGYLRRIAEGREGPALTPTANVQDGREQPAMMAAAWAQALAEERDSDTEGSEVPLRDPSHVAAGLRRIHETGVPEVMGIVARDGSGHAIVLYGYEDGNLLIYDSNYPGEVIRWPFDERRGLGPHPKGDRGRDDFYGKLTKATSVPFDRHRSAQEMGMVREACATGQPVCTGRFPTFAADLEPSVDGRRVAVAGRITGGASQTIDGQEIHRPARVWVSLDGKPVGVAPVRRDGTFRVVLPAGQVNAARSVRVVAATDGGSFAGHHDVRAESPLDRLRRRPSTPPARGRGLRDVIEGLPR